VNVTSISTVVKEYTLTHIKNSSHPDVRVAASIKHDIRNGKAYVHKDKHAIPDRPPPTPKADVDDSPMGTPSGSGAQTPARTGLGGHNHGLSLSHLADYFHSSNHSSTTSVPSQQVRTSADAFAGGVDPATAEPMDAQDAYLAAREEQREVELGDGEIDTMISIPLPVWTTPSHSIHPCFVTHKIKWSCVISNPDGHSAFSSSSLLAALCLTASPHSVQPLSFVALFRSMFSRPRSPRRPV
jgi:arrestin-related trafficking adapter 4/5/7